MRGQLLLVWMREERGDYVIYWQMNIFKWYPLWMMYVLYSILNIVLCLWLLRKIGVMERKATIEDWMRKYPKLWATPLIVPKEADKKFDYEKLMRRRFKNRDWDSFPAWMGYGIGPFTI